MAKTGFWLRGAKGKLAGTTIYKGKTGTIQREIVSPSNPQSEGQMTQRSRFLSAVRFYQRSNQRFFKMAFEGKRQGESDFNAFMRHNAKLGPYITKAQGDAIGFPMIAPWILSRGSMAPVAQSMYTDSDLERDYLHVVVSNSFSGVAPTTIGGVSAAFKASYPDISEGDIITLVDIGYTEAGNPFVDDLDAADISGSSLWNIQQFIINSNDARAISDVLSKTFCEIVDGTLVLSLAVGASDTVGGAACVLSRNSNSGLKVASTSLVLNNIALRTYEAMRANSHLEQVLAWWGASKPAILKGSIASEQGEPEPTVNRIEGSVLAGARSCILQSDLKSPFAAPDGTRFILAMAGDVGSVKGAIKDNVELTANGGSITGQSIDSDIVIGAITLSQNVSADGTIQFAVESSADFNLNTTIRLGMVVGDTIMYNDSYTTPVRKVIPENEDFNANFTVNGIPAPVDFEDGDKVIVSVDSKEVSGLIALDQFVAGDPEENPTLKSENNILGFEVACSFPEDASNILHVFADGKSVGHEVEVKLVSLTHGGIEYPIANN